MPRLKKPNLDKEDLKSYRPVSNLSFVGKIIEKAVVQQLNTYLQENNLCDPLQSAYRARHSTESALVKVKDDVNMIMDQGDAVVLVLLDLSAAFDTVDHHVLLQRLENQLGITGHALTWLRSYLENRRQCVNINNATSYECPLSVGVPQGSVIGPILFTLYSQPLGDVIDKHNIHRHSYADDTQLYARLPIKKPHEVQSTLRRMNECIDEVRRWMLKNKLKINDSKTELLVIGSKTALQKLGDLQIEIGAELVAPSEKVRNLGSIFDSEMSMQAQANDITKRAYFHLRRIRHIRKHLSNEACAKAIHVKVTSTLDFQNALLLGCPNKITKRLQLVQNNAARLLTRTNRRDHITPVLKNLHWLPIEARIKYKTLSMIHRSLHCENSPTYLKNILSLYQPARALRSSTDAWTLTVKRSSRACGEGAFSVLGPKLWNTLPLSLRSNPNNDIFKQNLKTHLFSIYF